MEKIINDVLKGKKDKYSLIMDAYYSEIFYYCYRQCFNYEDAKDLAHEVFVKAYLNLHRYNPSKATLRTWLYKIATNHVINFMKKKKLNISDITDELISDINISKSVENKETVREIHNVLNGLNSKDSKICRMHFLAELSAKEISEIEKLPLQTVYSIIKKGKFKVREIVGDWHE